MMPTTRRATFRAVLAATAAAVPLTRPVRAAAAQPPAASREATLYKNPQCDCCEGYAAYLRENGYEVRVLPSHDLALISRQQQVPPTLEGCHITMVDGYTVVGHVPIGPVNRLLAERPDIRGISLPGMPMGSPGMGGPKAAPFTIYTIPRDPAAEPAVYAVE
ncbi:DUF411 domain-containing protein [Falsiroseomonas tokyonensis]|uniref:DUF411 domain-containing protein n=1 Tax=Falsiroseomonas tokyonensis TaxID=430521 RepID=A0ABV7C1Y0_9PROT|nr:DUF411 domain-containing protein [Falsiroseomonas tokyonensis]